MLDAGIKSIFCETYEDFEGYNTFNVIVMLYYFLFGSLKYTASEEMNFWFRVLSILYRVLL